jgi:hypothetical protein
MAVSNDPHVWLQPYFARLREDPSFARLALSFQFEELCTAVEPEHPMRAAQMRDWSTAAQHALLKWLADALSQQHHQPATDETLWTVEKGHRRLTCLAVYLPIGVDLRLMEGAEFRRTELFQDAPHLNAKAAEWLTALRARGWLTTPSHKADAAS